LEGVREALDFGCGASRLLSIILGEHGIACDPYDPIYHPHTPYGQKRYDAIISIEVFEHLHDPIATLKQLTASLNPNGYLIIGTALLTQTHEEFLQWRYRVDPTHVVFYSLQSFESLASQFRLDIIAHNGKNLVILRVK
jgi:SAM-dependent methyltransferase